MGLGGYLMWTPSLHALSNRLGRQVMICNRPRLSDILHGRMYDSSVNFSESEIFQDNPYICSNQKHIKTRFDKQLDGMFEMFLDLFRLKRLYEWTFFRLSKRSGFLRVYLDLWQHNYVSKETHERYVWKKGGHIIDIIGATLGLSGLPHKCELYLRPEDEKRVSAEIEREGLNSFVTVEPCTNTEYFGELRAWPFERWQEVVEIIRKDYPSVKIVQVGARGSRSLQGVVNMCGRLSFRETAFLMKKSLFFMGTEGGLQHAVNAVDAKALVIWGGLTVPEFAAYPDRHEVLCAHVECSPCGLRSACLNGHICMQRISVESVMEKVHFLLKQAGVGGADEQ